MDDGKMIIDAVTSEAYDAAEKPFDFVEEGKETALVCEQDAAARAKLVSQLKENGYLVTEASTAQDALKSMRYHNYDLVAVNENFDVNDSGNEVLAYLAELDMQLRRKMFVALLGERLRTNDNMAAFNKSVNLIVNNSNLDDAGAIIKKAVAENKAFYHVYMEILKQAGRG
ncbi:MAG: hypothetical protein M0P57_15090 [Syntrophales bacterium]|jgi:CheY-like chemotaxis protein|nr:hypothetical protein [Syntrophales bacterium]MDY0043250.1 hypothetical protein [Syntrophales bacterium]